MDLRALLIILPFLFVGYLMELAYHKGKKDGILKVKHMLDGDLDD